MSVYRYSWWKNEEKLNWNTVRILRPNPTVGNIEIRKANYNDTGYYQCRITGKYGTAVSGKAWLLDQFNTQISLLGTKLSSIC